MVDQEPGSIECPWCGQWTRTEFIQSHVICISCKRPVEDCCDGETADSTENQGLKG